jgi:hypothetical protein
LAPLNLGFIWEMSVYMNVSKRSVVAERPANLAGACCGASFYGFPFPCLTSAPASAEIAWDKNEAAVLSSKKGA